MFTYSFNDIGKIVAAHEYQHPMRPSFAAGAVDVVVVVVLVLEDIQLTSGIHLLTHYSIPIKICNRVSKKKTMNF